MYGIYYSVLIAKKLLEGYVLNMMNAIEISIRKDEAKKAFQTDPEAQEDLTVMITV